MAERRPFQLAVECHAGYRGEQTPLRFRLDDQSVEIDEILDQWLAPDHRYFKVRSAGGDTWILRHDVTTAEWDLTLFTRATTSG